MPSAYGYGTRSVPATFQEVRFQAPLALAALRPFHQVAYYEADSRRNTKQAPGQEFLCREETRLFRKSRVSARWEMSKDA